MKYIFHALLDPTHILGYLLIVRISCVGYKYLDADSLFQPPLKRYFCCIESNFIYSYSHFQTQYDYQERRNSFLIMSITHKYLCSLKALELPTSVGSKSCSQKFSGSVLRYPYIIVLITAIHL